MNNGWLDLELRKPNVGQRVLIWDSDTADVRIAYYFYHNGKDAFDPWERGTAGTLRNIRYWQMLPYRPKEE